VLASILLRVKPKVENSFNNGPCEARRRNYMLNILRQPPKRSSIPAIMMKNVLQPQPG
jgi:hypothetical protein